MKSILSFLISMAFATTPFEEITTQISNSFERVQSNETCVTELEDVNSRIKYLGITTLGIDDFENQLSLEEALAYLNENFEQVEEYLLNSRKALSNLIHARMGLGVSRDCITAWKRYNFYSRYLIEYLAEVASRDFSPAPKRNDSLKAGDVIVFRSSGHYEARLSHIFAQDGAYSNTAIVVENLKKQKFIATVLPKKGKLILPVDRLNELSAARMTLLRPRSAELAKQASLEAWRIINSRRNFRYDPSYGDDKERSLHSVELTKMAFEKALEKTGEGFSFPVNSSTIPIDRNPRFYSKVNIASKSQTSADDFLVEPRLQIIEEYTDRSQVKSLHMEEAVVERMFAYMEDQEYSFNLKRHCKGLKMSDYSFLKGTRKTRRAAKTFALFDRVAQIISIEFKTLLAEQEANFKRPLTPLEMMDLVDIVRARDMERYFGKIRKSNFTKYFNPYQKK